MNIVHRDVKPDNLIRRKDDVLKFIDFGISKELSQEQTKHTKNVVTRCYRSPEIFFGADQYDSKAVDMWSVACIFAELLTANLTAPPNQTPVFFAGGSDIEQLGKIFEVCGTPTPEDWPECEELPCYLPFNPVESIPLEKVMEARRVKPSEELPPSALALL